MSGEKKGLKVVRISSVVISVLFHPAFLPVYGLLILFNAPTFIYYIPGSIKRVIFMLATVNMTVVPLALLPLLRYRNVITSYSVDNRVERIIPLGIGSMMYIITTFIFYSYQIPVIIKSFMLGSSITSILVLILTFRWKVSIHSAGAGGLLGFVMALSIRLNTDLISIWITLMVICGLVMSSRLILRSHNPGQVYSGFILGFLSFFVTLLLS